LKLSHQLNEVALLGSSSNAGPRTQTAAKLLPSIAPAVTHYTARQGCAPSPVEAPVQVGGRWAMVQAQLPPARA
jgi:hypothetical protein